MGRDKKKILLVEDTEETRNHFAKLLRNKGYAVSTAKDGLEAIEKASVENPDLVLLDIQLPHLDGYEVLEAIKQRAIETRVIMYSGFEREIDTAVRCVKGGACDFLTKPIESGILTGKIQRYLLLEDTINTKVQKTPEIVVRSLMEDLEEFRQKARLLGTEVTRLQKELKHERSSRHRVEILPKLMVVIIAMCAG
jgi:DNA-binding response OmpR family regulator